MTVCGIRLGLPCNLGIPYLLALTAGAFVLSGLFQPFMEIYRFYTSLFCLSDQATERRLLLHSIATGVGIPALHRERLTPRMADTTVDFNITIF